MKKVCPYPWLVASFEMDHTARVCCEGEIGQRSLKTSRGDSLSLKKSFALEEIMNAPLLKKIRQSFLEGKVPDFCQGCEKKGESEGASPREVYYEAYKHCMPEAILATQEDGTLSRPMYRALDISLGNVCNLTCRMCRPEFSQNIGPLYEEFGLSFTKIDSSLKLTEQKDFFHNLESVLPYISHITFQGGEPTVSPWHQKILELILKLGLSSKIELIYVTNATNIPDSLIKLWAKFDVISFNLSLDAVDEVYEYIRPPAKWETVQFNLQKLLKLKPFVPHLRFDVQCVFQVYNAHYLVELFEFMREHPAFAYDLPRLFYLEDPPFLAPHHLSQETKNEIFKKVENFVLVSSSPSKRKENIISCLETFRNTRASEQQKNLMATYTKFLDSKYKT